ncbi:MAG: murein biosynthesis integral membrane protein MurJ [Gemmatimonadales bacterium]
MKTPNRGSYFVAAGILLSRIAGLVRQRIFSKYLGISDASDIWNAAFRIPNFLQNLFGEGALSASFIPSYSRLLGAGRDEEARRLAGAVLSLLAATVAILVLAGELATPWLVDLIVPRFTPESRDITTTLVRILFPAAGLLVLSAWCLGVLNSHRKFLLSYAAPVVWNATIILTVVFGAAGKSEMRFVVVAAWGAVLGSFLQIAVQWPAVRAVGGAIRPQNWRGVEGVPQVVHSFLPNLISRGANQISALIDVWIAGFIPGAITAMGNAQVLYTLPVSLFGMAISAAELPEMSRERGDPEAVAQALRVRLDAATQRLAYYIIPSAVGFICLGGVISAAVFQSGKFNHTDSQYVWIVLAGSAIGLLASTLGRLYASTFYALHDTTTPLRCGLVRIVLTGVLGLLAARVLPGLLGVDQKWGAAGITASAGMAGWIEFTLLRRGLRRRLGNFSLPRTELAKLWTAAVISGAASTAMRLVLPDGAAPIPVLLATVPLNAVVFLGITTAWDIPESAVLTGRIRRVAARLWSRP